MTHQEIIDKLLNGEINEFQITYPERNITIFVDKEGNYLYRLFGDERLPVNFEIASMNGEVSCKFSCSEEVDLSRYVKDSFKTDVDLAVDEVIDVKRRVRSIFNNKK